MKYKSTEQTLSWFRDRYMEGNLALKPPYQRKPVWQARQKCHLIESVLLEYPVPEVFIQQSTSADGITKYAVVDGQQRIRAILQFCSSDESSEEAEIFNGFILDKIDPQSDFYGAEFQELSNPVKSAFYGYSLAVRFLESSDEAEMKAMFRRLNRYTVPLNAQELRNATYEGPLPRLVERLSNSVVDRLAELGMISAASIRRMGDVEFVAELLIGAIHGPQGGSPTAIDSFYTMYEDYDDQIPNERTIQRQFSLTWTLLDTTIEQLSQRWRNKTDFYSLFLASAAILSRGQTINDQVQLADTLNAFAAEVDQAIAQDAAKVSEQATNYARAVQKGVNGKSRRAERHAALLEVLEPLATDKSSK
jgi:hypothetical protein